MIRTESDRLFGHVCQMQMLNASKSWTCQICNMKSSNGWTLMVLCSFNGLVLYSFNGWTQIVQLPVFSLPKRISEKPKLFACYFWITNSLGYNGYLSQRKVYTKWLLQTIL